MTLQSVHALAIAALWLAGTLSVIVALLFVGFLMKDRRISALEQKLADIELAQRLPAMRQEAESWEQKVKESQEAVEVILHGPHGAQFFNAHG